VGPTRGRRPAGTAGGARGVVAATAAARERCAQHCGAPCSAPDRTGGLAAALVRGAPDRDGPAVGRAAPCGRPARCLRWVVGALIMAEWAPQENSFYPLQRAP